MLFDYLTLKIIWWLFVGVLLIGFALMDGFDLGIGTLLPFVARTDDQRRVMINAIGPTWEGNQVWLITAGGALFAAWPLVYAAWRCWCRASDCCCAGWSATAGRNCPRFAAR